MEDWERWADTVRITPLDVNTPYAGNGYAGHGLEDEPAEQYLEVAPAPARTTVDACLHAAVMASLVLLIWAVLVLLVLVMLGVIHPLAPYEGGLGL